MSHRYVGSELELFSAAKNWKTYVASVLSRFIGGTVLEVGAGIGSNITYLHSGRVCEWTSLEPDPDLARCIAQARAVGALPADLRVIAGTIDSVDTAARFDTILYLDVLEHIEMMPPNSSEPGDFLRQKAISSCSRRPTSFCSALSMTRSAITRAMIPQAWQR